MARNHYVMRSHLRRFCLESPGRLYPYEKGVGLLTRYFRRGIGPRGLGWAEDFYATLKRDGTISRELDEALSKVEQWLFRNLPNDQSCLCRCANDPSYFPSSQAERDEISHCIAFSYLRVPVQIHNAAMVGRLALEVVNADEPAIVGRSIEKGLRRENAVLAFETAREAICRGLLTDPRRVGLASLLSQEHAVAAMHDMRWQIIEPAAGSYFLTSDNPVVLCDPDSNSRLQGIRASPGTQVWFPVSHSCGLLLGWRAGFGERRAVLGHSQTRALNRRTIKWCYKHVYAPRREDWIHSATRECMFSPLLDAPSHGNASYGFDALVQGERADTFEGMQLH